MPCLRQRGLFRCEYSQYCAHDSLLSIFLDADLSCSSKALEENVKLTDGMFSLPKQ